MGKYSNVFSPTYCVCLCVMYASIYICVYTCSQEEESGVLFPYTFFPFSQTISKPWSPFISSL